MTRLFAVPVELAEANEVVDRLHRHHDAMQTHRFSIGAIDAAGVLHGVAICARPAARALSARDVLEVARLCTDGTPNACSLLYAAAARAGRAMGYKRIQTYILDEETGTSLTAAGWRFDGLTDPVTETAHNWANRPGRSNPARLQSRKGRWVKDLDARPDFVSMPAAIAAAADPTLDFGASA